MEEISVNGSGQECPLYTSTYFSRRNSEMTSIVPTMGSFNFSRSDAGIQYSRCPELPTVCTS